MALVTFETVAAAAEALQLAGQRPSVRAVIAHLGGGSPNAVLKHLGEWKAGRPLVRAADTDLDPRITTAIIDQMQRIAVAAAAAAEERAAGIEDDLQALADAQQASEQQIEALIVERDASHEQAEGLAHQLANVQAGAERAEQLAGEQAAALRAELAGERKHQEQTAAALVKAEVRLEALPDLHTEIARLRAALDVEGKARVAAEQQAAVLAAKLEDADRRVAELDARATKAEQQVQTITRDLTSTNVAVQAGQARLESAARELEDVRKQAKEAREEAKKAREATAELRGRMGAEQPPKGSKARPKAGQAGEGEAG